MIERVFDPTKPHVCVAYARMSDPRQNPRSPEQQFAEINREIAARRLPWRIVKRYRDDGISGRLVMKRPGLQQMLRDIRCRAVKPDMLLIDTRMRLGRAEELKTIRRELANQHGVYIVSADHHFTDPTTSAGRVLEVVDELRAIEDNNTKAHDVCRGKLDQVLRGFWPGGKPPHGFRLRSQFRDVAGEQVLEGKILVPDPEWAWIVQTLFERADSTGDGQTRLAKFINKHTDVPERLLPIPASTVGEMLKSELYYGAFRYPKHATDIVDDVRVCEPTDLGKQVIVPNFCEPLVSFDLWQRVQAARFVRGQKIVDSRGTDTEKLIQPLTRGVSIKHFLSGLVRCGHCGAAMVAVGPSRTTDPSRRYVYFMCPQRRDGNCDNEQSVPAKWLEKEVIELLKAALLLGI